MCLLPSLRTPLPLDFEKLQLESSKAIKLSTDKNKRMLLHFFFQSLHFHCRFIPLSPFCSTLCPLPYPPLGLRALPNPHLLLSGHCLHTPPPPPSPSGRDASPCWLVYHLFTGSLQHSSAKLSLFFSPCNMKS